MTCTTQRRRMSHALIVHCTMILADLLFRSIRYWGCLNALGIRRAHSCAHLDRHRMCAQNNCAFSPTDFRQRHLDKQSPTLIPEENVLCTSGWRGSPLTVPTHSVTEQFSAFAPRCQTSVTEARHHASSSTSSMQMNETWAQSRAALLSQVSAQL